MNPPPPPPPPPHGNGTGTGNRGSGLPPGNYDIFIIPPHSSGSGFLYLPSLQPHRNSFLAGVGCTMLAMAIWTVVFPVLREWFATIVASGGVAVVILLIGVGVAGWAWGKTQTETTRPPEGAAGGASSAHAENPHNANGYAGSTPASGPTPQYTPGPEPRPPPQFTPGPEPRPPPKPTWQRANTGPDNANGTANTGTAKGGWEKAREETRKKEEVRKRVEELRKKREEDEKERVRQREKDARERELRELKEAREKREREAREKREKEVKEKARASPTPPPPPSPHPSPKKTESSRPASPSKRHQPPTAQTATEDDAYSFRPYDKPKRPVHKTTSTSASSIYSESSYAPSQSTSRTTPPPTHRGPYHSKDPDKIVLKAVYSFNNTFTKLPIAQLVSGVGSVTDGLILRITTEGLFIDDDVRGVPQREWDVKAWTLKLVEVWCPHLHSLGASSGSTPAPHRTGMFGAKNTAATKAPTGEESDRFVDGLTRACKPVFLPSAKLGEFSSKYSSSNSSASSQSGEHKGLHVLRASIRDQDGKRYVFVLQEEEGWKVAVGLQRLRRGTQVRALGVSGMAVGETKGILESMGWI